MREKIPYVLIFMIVLLVATSTVLWSDSKFCPLPAAGDKAAVDLPQKKIMGTGKSYSIPRNQVFVEIGTATW